MSRHLVVRVLVDDAAHDELWRRLAELLAARGVAAWQVDRYDHEELGDRPGQHLPNDTLEAALAAVSA
jgi:hypothetical protein